MRHALRLRPLQVFTNQGLGPSQAVGWFRPAAVLRGDLAVDGAADAVGLRSALLDGIALFAERRQAVLPGRDQQLPNLFEGETQRLVSADAAQRPDVVVAVQAIVGVGARGRPQ